MKPYGVPRAPELDGWPDLADIHNFGLKSYWNKLPGKNGERKNSFRKPAVKARRRRIWKKKARRAGKKLIFVNSE